MRQQQQVAAMRDSYASQFALSLLLGMTALAIALVLGPSPAPLVVAALVGVIAVITCPSPP
jgi:hypothetical protein